EFVPYGSPRCRAAACRRAVASSFLPGSAASAGPTFRQQLREAEDLFAFVRPGSTVSPPTESGQADGGYLKRKGPSTEPSRLCFFAFKRIALLVFLVAPETAGLAFTA